MKEKIVRLNEKDLEDLYKGLVIAMKELDLFKRGSDRLLADRLEKLLKKIEEQTCFIVFLLIEFEKPLLMFW